MLLFLFSKQMETRPDQIRDLYKLYFGIVDDGYYITHFVIFRLTRGLLAMVGMSEQRGGA